jgi:outer membrane protein assembly factor BamE (lipoprotein component of BamABCDE complex)
MSRATLLALALVGSVILLTALLGNTDKRLEPVEVPAGMTVKRQISLLVGSPSQARWSMESGAATLLST